MFSGVVLWKSGGGKVGWQVSSFCRDLSYHNLWARFVERHTSQEKRGTSPPLKIYFAISPCKGSRCNLGGCYILLRTQKFVHGPCLSSSSPSVLFVIWRCTGFALLYVIMHLTFSWCISNEVHAVLRVWPYSFVFICQQKGMPCFRISFNCWILSYICNLLTILHAGVRTASVIIALTDGELQDVQFYYAEQEVSHLHVYPN